MQVGTGRRVVVWCLALDPLPADAWTAVQGLLATEEREAVARHVRPNDRHAAAAMRALAKGLLAASTATAPGDWRLGKDAAGAPLALGPDDRAAHSLSLSRTRGAVAAATSQAGAVGVDIERADAAPDGAAVATALFAAVDRVTMRAATDPADAFIRIWTLKEAVLKALGTGFALPPDHAGILSLAPPRLGFAPDYAEAPGWSLRHTAHGPFRTAAACRADAADIEIRWVRILPGALPLFHTEP